MSTYEDLLGNDEDENLNLVVGEDALGAFTTEILGNDDSDEDYSLVVGAKDDSGLDPWLHKLDPRYWIKSSREKSFVDAEKKKGKEIVAANKKLGDQRKELEAGKRAVDTARAAQAASEESKAIEQQLQDIQQSVSGSFVGADEAVKEGIKAAKKNQVASSLLAQKAARGEKLSPEETVVLRRCMKMCKDLRSLHTQLHEKSSNDEPVSSSGYRTSAPVPKGSPSASFLGENVQEILGGAGSAPAQIAKKNWVEMAAIAATHPEKLAAYTKKRNIVLNADQRDHLKNMASLTKVALAKQVKGQAKKKGLSGDDLMGLSFGKVAAVAALPAAALAYGAYKGVKWTGKKIFGSKSASPAQQRAARIKASQNRRLAALKRMQAADIETDAARSEQLAAQEAADTENAAQSAEADAQSAQQEAAEAPYMNSPDDTDDESGSFVGNFVGLSQTDFIGDFVGAIADPKAKQIVTAAATNTPIGHKIRAGAAVYKSAAKGDPKARIAIAKISAKAKRGDPQAKRDLNAVKAGKIALQAKGKAACRIASKGKADKRVDLRKRLENAAGNKLARVSHKRQLAHAARVERKASAGDKKARATVAAVVAKAKKGDPKAKSAVKAMQLSRHVRKAAKTPAERKALVEAHKLVRRARSGNKKAIRQVRVVQAAAKSGQPNAKRALARMQTAAAVEKTIKTGKIVVPSKKPDTQAAAKKSLAFYGARVKAGVATREEALAAAKSAQKLGLKDEAASLAFTARQLRPASQGLKNAAAVAAAAQGGHPEAQKVISSALEEAEAGNPAGINSAGNLAAVQALNAVQHGQPMPPEIAEATSLIERAHAGDPEAKRIIERVSQASQSGDASGVKAAVALTAAGAVMASMAGKSAAKSQWSSKAQEARGQKLAPNEVKAVSAEFAELNAKVHDGTATNAEARRARELALALGKPALAAEISALMPTPAPEDVLTSLPDRPLPAINNWRDALRESIRALTFSTPDPIQNFREGVQSRGATPMLPVIEPGAPASVARKG